MATKRKDGLWQQQVSVVVNGQRKQKYFYGKTKQEVLRKISAFEQEQATGPLFSKVADEYWYAAIEGLAVNSQRNYRPAYTRAKKYFGDTHITDIHPVNVRQFMTHYIETQNPAKKTAGTQRQILLNIFSFAFDKGYITENPAAGLKLKKGLSQTVRDLPPDEEIRIIKNSWDKPFGMFAYWVLYTGLRRSELLALTWEDVDLEANTIRVNKTLYYVNGRAAIKPPKTAKGDRIVPLMSALRKRLEPGEGLIFKNTYGTYIAEKQFQRLWGRYAEQTGIESTPHQIRHAYATMLFDNDVDAKDAQELMGHAQLSTTQNIYTHIREERRKKIRDKLIDVDFNLEENA